MANRLFLSEAFHSILDNVYFQPPELVKLKYPAIVYEVKNFDVKHANNMPYTVFDAYEVTLIDPNPDCENMRKILQLPNCRFDRFFTSENLNHYVFTIYNI